MQLHTGISAEKTITVTSENVATAVHSGGLEVFATPSMIALMESTAVKCVADYLDLSQTTVGIAVNVKHVGASPIGETITATATLTAIDGRKLTFSVQARDRKKLIGEGVHERFMVDIEKFMNKLK